MSLSAPVKALPMRYFVSGLFLFGVLCIPSTTIIYLHDVLSLWAISHLYISRGTYSPEKKASVVVICQGMLGISAMRICCEATCGNHDKR